MQKINLLEDEVMKKILLALILGLVFFPVTASAQRWIDPYIRQDGTFVEGQWSSPKDSWQRSYSQPGAFNPLTGQFNTYGSRNYLAPPNRTLSPQSLYAVPGSSAPNPYAVPGSSGPNPYAVPGSSPKLNAPIPSNLYNQGPYGSGR
jgi:hypothetical protein